MSNKAHPAPMSSIAAVVAIALAFAGCGRGSGSDGAGSTTTTGAKATTTEATTTTVARADEARAAASAALVFAEDLFPEGWTVAVEAASYETEGLAVDGCFNPEGGVLSQVPLGAAHGGPTMQAPDAPFFISSWAVTFADEADAEAWASSMGDADVIECRRATMEASNRDGDEDFEVREVPVESPAIGEDGREAAVQFELVAGGEGSGVMRIDVYRSGASVLTVSQELGSMTDDQANAGLAVEAELRTKVLGA